MNVYLAEVIGTMIVIILGDGVVANVSHCSHRAS